jgi:hypothetical protein
MNTLLIIFIKIKICIFRSGSDPALAMNMSEPSRTEPIVRFFRSQDENRKPSTESMGSLTGSRPSRWGGGHRTPDSSPKSSEISFFFCSHDTVLKGDELSPSPFKLKHL